MQALIPIVMLVVVLSLLLFALFAKQATPWKGKRQVVFKSSDDGSFVATRKSIVVPFTGTTQVSVAPERILPSRRLLMTEAMKLPELEAEKVEMSKRAREPEQMKGEDNV
jgi:hypothetical protein